MTYNHPERDEDLQDAGLRSGVHRPAAYGADRRPSGFYGMLLVGVALLLAIVIYALGIFGSPMDKTANNPPIDKLPVTTGQGSQSR